MKKIKKILVGTHNKGKIKEISYLLNKKIKKITPFQLNIKSPKETEKTFRLNSELKAKYFFKKSKIVTISDDSGLCVDCLNNKPGIHSARWAQRYKNFDQAMKKIIALVKNKNKGKKIKKLLSLEAKKNDLIISFSGLDALIKFDILNSQIKDYQKIITREMLKKNFLATNAIYVSISHTDSLIKKYISEMSKIFKKISYKR